MEINKKEDRATLRLLAKVREKRRELRELETELSKACDAYGRRRGMSLFREWHVENQAELEKRNA